MKLILFISAFLSLNTFATASGPDYLEVSIEGKKQVVKNLGCHKKICKVSFKGKTLSFPVSKTREALGPISPTFDCSKASFKAESLICHEPKLANLDRHMAIIYKDSK